MKDPSNSVAAFDVEGLPETTPATFDVLFLFRGGVRAPFAPFPSVKTRTLQDYLRDRSKGDSGRRHLSENLRSFRLNDGPLTCIMGDALYVTLEPQNCSYNVLNGLSLIPPNHDGWFRKHLGKLSISSYQPNLRIKQIR